VALCGQDAPSFPGSHVSRLANAPAIGAVQWALGWFFLVLATRGLADGSWDTGGVGPNFVFAATFLLWAQVIWNAVSTAVADESFSADASTSMAFVRFIAGSGFPVFAGGFAFALASGILLVGAASMASLGAALV